MVRPVAALLALFATVADASVLERIDTVGGPQVSVRLHVSGPVAAQTQQLPPRASAPDRIVIDLPGTRLGTGARGVVSGRGPLLRVRTGQLDDDTARVVLDLDGPMSFTMANEDGMVTITLELAPDAPSTPPMIPSVTVPSVGGSAAKSGAWRTAVPPTRPQRYLDYDIHDIEPLPAPPGTLEVPPPTVKPAGPKRPYLRYEEPR
ncbi:MAG TPA: AMIN domain-containing protein [Candidatus Binatia bacterium]|jgi:hypothetical protein|nr:AMIN domain-containing protein [Candidatus Binatia bacterium]